MSIQIERRNKQKASPSRPRTGTVPNITSVVPVGVANPTRVTINFDEPVIIAKAPNWWTTGLAVNLKAQSIVSKAATGLSIVLDFGSTVTGMTGLSIPQSNFDALSRSGQPVPPGEYEV